MTERRHIFETMGTVVSLTVAIIDPDALDLKPIVRIFDRFDAKYSLYKPESELSRIASGEIDLVDASEELRETYAVALDWRESTHGDFTPHRPDGVIDLSGVVKAMAMERAGTELLRSGIRNWCLNAGGDVLVCGGREVSEPWVVGIIDPADKAALVASTALVGSRRACATSGIAERGDHIWTVGGRSPSFVQATVLADDIVTADVLATTIIAGGPDALDRICASWQIDAMTVDHDGNIRMTPDFAMSIASER